MKLEKKIIFFFKKNFKAKNFLNHKPLIDISDLKQLKKCINSTFVSTVGIEIEKFCLELKKIIKSKYIIPFNSGTSALHLALLGNEINNNHEVLLPSINFVAAANAVLYSNATPHFIDVCKNNLTIDFDNLEKYLNKFKFKKKNLYNPKTKKFIKAIIVLHTFGYVADLTKARKICKKFNLILIEDAAEALGSYFNKIHVGNFGKCGILSFNGNKVITTGAGGALITNNKKLYSKILNLSKVSKTSQKYIFDYDRVGYNYRMPNLNASLGISQLKKLKKILQLKKRLHDKYANFFHTQYRIKLLQERINTKSNHWLNTIIIDFKKINKRSQFNFLDNLNKKGIQIRPLWKPMHRLNYLKKYPRMKMINTEYLEYRVYNLPSGPEILNYEK